MNELLPLYARFRLLEIIMLLQHLRCSIYLSRTSICISRNFTSNEKKATPIIQAQKRLHIHVWWVDAYFDFLKKQHVPIKKIYTFSFRFDKGGARLCFRKSEETWFPAMPFTTTLYYLLTTKNYNYLDGLLTINSYLLEVKISEYLKVINLPKKLQICSYQVQKANKFKSKKILQNKFLESYNQFSINDPKHFQGLSFKQLQTFVFQIT